MNQAARCVLFDLDGTLLDTAADFTRVLNAMLEQHQRPPLSYADIRQTVSDGARAMVKLAFGVDEGEAGYNELRQDFLDRYETQLDLDTRLFGGMDAVLAEIEQSGGQWGIVTNKPLLYSEKILASLKLETRCGVLVCPDHVSQKKPHPESLYLACKTLDRKIHEAVYIGDHRRDIDAGRNAGMTTIAAAYGYVHADESVESWGADFIIQSVSELPPLLKNM